MFTKFWNVRKLLHSSEYNIYWISFNLTWKKNEITWFCKFTSFKGLKIPNDVIVWNPFLEWNIFHISKHKRPENSIISSLYSWFLLRLSHVESGYYFLLHSYCFPFQWDNTFFFFIQYMWICILMSIFVYVCAWLWMTDRNYY